MIAKPDQHFPRQVLYELLDERLSGEDARRVEDHLSSCENCRETLREIAGQDHWWNETVEVLSDSALRTPSRLPREDQSIHMDRSADWILPLLEACPDTPGALGRLDDYLVHGVIGQGGMGVVLRGVDPHLNRPVAIKVLSPHLAGVGAARARFMREAQAAAAIVHPSIVPIYSVANSARLPYLVMPCIQGGNLQQRIEREGPLELDQLLLIGVQIAEGLAAAHRHGVIHRDIKPANILIEEGNGRVLISDFGLARALDDASLTVSGMIAGTPQYMSPEQARGEPIDARTDLYSLGSLLYALATGRPPFRADSPLAVLRKISDTRPRPIHHVNERLPAWLDTLVSQLMKTDRDKRVESAEKATELLREAHAHVRNPSHHGLPKSLSSPTWKRFAPAMAAACLPLALISAWAAWSLSNDHRRALERDSAASARPTAIIAQQTSPTQKHSIEIESAADSRLLWIDYQWLAELASTQAELDTLDANLRSGSFSSQRHDLFYPSQLFDTEDQENHDAEP
jgi:serine/threonine protein kinase